MTVILPRVEPRTVMKDLMKRKKIQKWDASVFVTNESARAYAGANGRQAVFRICQVCGNWQFIGLPDKGKGWEWKPEKELTPILRRLRQENQGMFDRSQFLFPNLKVENCSDACRNASKANRARGKR